MKLHTIDHFGVVFVSMSKPVCMPNHSHKNAFCLLVRFHANKLIFI